MTRKVYKSAMGKSVDLGALLLQNEQVRAVGNMNVNAAGDLVDSNNRVIDQRNRQVQRQYKKQTNVTATPVDTSNLSARKRVEPEPAPPVQTEIVEPVDDDVLLDPVALMSKPAAPVSESESVAHIGAGGLAAAMARSREVKQELEKTRKQQLQEKGIRKI